MNKRENILENRKIVIVDVETTGLYCGKDGYDDAEISRIDATKIENGKILETFSTYVFCEKEISENIAKLTGINNTTLIGAPKCEEALKMFVDFSEDFELHARNGEFVNRFFSFYGNKYGVKVNECCEFNDRICKVLNFPYVDGLLRLFNIKKEDNETLYFSRLLIKLQEEEDIF